MSLYQGECDKLLEMTILRWIETKGTKPVVLHAKQAQEGGICIALTILDVGARRGW